MRVQEGLCDLGALCLVFREIFFSFCFILDLSYDWVWVCLVCWYLTVRNMIKCGCYFDVECYGSVQCWRGNLLDIPCMVFQRGSV